MREGNSCGVGSLKGEGNIAIKNKKIMIFKRDNSCSNTINLLLQIIDCRVIFRGLIKGLQELNERRRQSHAERAVSVSLPRSPFP